MEILSLKDVSKEYGDNLILDNISLDLKEGDICGVIGVSGSGKSTLLHLMVGLIEPEEGDVIFHTVSGNKRLFKHNLLEIQKKVGFTPQKISFYPKLTVKENLLHFGQMYGLKKKILVNNAKSLLQFTGLIEFRNSLAEELSGGMQKRLDIACSLIHKPKLLILDEPVAHLDPSLKREILHLIKEVNKQGVTVVVASHDLESVESICNKIIILHNGKVKHNVEIENLRTSFAGHDSFINIKTGKYHDLMLEFVKQLAVKDGGLDKIIDRKNHIILETRDMVTTSQNIISFITTHDLLLNQIELSQPSLKTIFEETIKEKRWVGE